jgi:dTDP-glucose pyrophosphorylase
VPIIDAMKKIDLNSAGLLYVVEDGDFLKGCITDGDIRRWIIKTGSIDGVVSDAMNTQPRYVRGDDAASANRLMEREKIYSVAVLNDSDRIIDILFYGPALHSDIEKRVDALSGIPVIVMAGGKGSRLYPFTKILPKPLIPIGDIPILERIFMNYYRFGVRYFYLTVNYRKEMIKSYFSDLNTPYEIEYIEESEPLGTAGSISLVNKKFDKPVIVTNCDILINCNYDEIDNYHQNSQNKMTIVSSLKNFKLPYGVLKSGENGLINSMEEKPELSYFINTGMYVVEPDCLDLIPPNTVFHMTQLAEKLLENGEKVGMFPISEGSFLDMGQFDEMKKMEERIEELERSAK